MYTYTHIQSSMCPHVFFMYEWTVHGWEMKKVKEGTVSASKNSDLFSLNAKVVWVRKAFRDYLSDFLIFHTS